MPDYLKVVVLADRVPRLLSMPLLLDEDISILGSLSRASRLLPACFATRFVRYLPITGKISIGIENAT